MSTITDHEGEPIYDYPELINNPHYQKYMGQLEFLVHRQYHLGTPVTRDDQRELIKILKIPN